MYIVFIITVIILLMIQVILSHPIQSSSPEEELIRIDVFSQLVSGHWEFDHLDSIMGQSHKKIADRLQNRINIDIIQPSLLNNNNNPQQRVMTTMQSTENMEYDLLKSQMMNAIQARAQELLPEMWDQVGGEALGRPKMERYIQDLLRASCPPEKEDIITLICLKNHLSEFAFHLNEYVQIHLTQIWNQLHQDTLPDLLNTIAKDLENLIAYFNDNNMSHRIRLTVLPWHTSVMDPTLFALSFKDESDDHSLFSSFVSLAKV